jgi:16S rRNA (cytidine1402-2'-O)-methyltransferase
VQEPLEGLWLVSGPIGNLGDLSERAADTLRRAAFWIVEDTRVSAKLAQHLELRKPMVVLNDHTSPQRVQGYVDRVALGESAALLTDAGTPGISDPGAEIVARCIASQVPVDAVPGPSAVTDALMLSGFYAQRFVFLGFLGKKPGPMLKEFQPYSDSPLTLVLFESPFRIGDLIAVASEVLGSRRYAICRELTKRHQQVFRSAFPYVPSEKELPRKGEITLVIEGKRRKIDNSA